MWKEQEKGKGGGSIREDVRGGGGEKRWRKHRERHKRVKDKEEEGGET